MKKRILAFALAAVMALSLVACGAKEETKTETPSTPSSSTSTPAAPEKIDPSTVSANLLLGTAGSGGTWYSLGAGIADAVTKGSKLKVSVATTNGTVDNNRLVAAGDIDIAMSQAPAEFHAQNGEDLFEGTKVDNVMWIHGGNFSKGQMVVPANSDIKSFADLAGKDVAIGAVGSGIRHYVGRGTLLLNGMDLDSFNALAMNQTQGAEAMQDGDVAASMYSGGIGLSSILSVASVMDIRILPVADDAIDNLSKTRPEWTAAMKYFTLPAGTYGDKFEETQVVGFITTFLVREDMDEEVVYAWLEYVSQYAPTLTSISAEAAEYTMENLAAGKCIEAHPGAVKWFADHGVEIK